MDVIPAYRTVPSSEGKDDVLEALENGGIDCVTFGSSSTVRNFFAAVGTEVMKRHPEVRLAAIGPVTAQTLRDAGIEPDIQPGEFTIPALVDAVCANLAGRGEQA